MILLQSLPGYTMLKLMKLGMGSFSVTFLLLAAGALWDASPRAPVAAAQTPLPAPVISAAVAEVKLPAVQVAPAVEVLPTPDVLRPVMDRLPEIADADERWSPPVWFPEAARDDLWALEGLQGEPTARPPTLRSRAVFVYDVDSGKVLIAHNADDRRPVASLTKVVSSLTAMAESAMGPGENAALEQTICVDESLWPSWPGARSYLNTGACLTGWDLLGAALVASDNRAAFGLSRVAGLPFQPFVSKMNDVAADLGMSQSTFSDPAGVDDNNLSTARDMTAAILSASLHPVLGPVASAPYWDVEIVGRARPKRVNSTNRLSGDKGLEFLAAKTGYTDTARYCFTAVVRTPKGRRIAMTVLGANRVRTRWSDVREVLAWVDRQPS